MIIGFVSVCDNAVNTHRDSYLLANLSVVSVRRPFLGAALVLGGGFIGFSAAFSDLLHAHEIATIAALSVSAIAAGFQVGQLSLLSRDLKGTELSGAVWGRAASLQTIRHEIISVIETSKAGGSA